jgi:AcrR family transcriptional regulator
MGWRKHDGPHERRGYHHGNLREALIRAALELIASKGAAGFTFAEAARQAGVSPAAPYRHYRDRDALLADVAERGFERFVTVLTAAWQDGRPSPAVALERMGRAYLAFAAAEPALYTAMFESGLEPKLYPAMQAAGDRAFATLREACEQVAAAMPGDRRPPALMLSLHIWSLCHGIAALFGRGDAARRITPIAADELLESALLIYLRGLGGEPSTT